MMRKTMTARELAMHERINARAGIGREDEPSGEMVDVGGGLFVYAPLGFIVTEAKGSDGVWTLTLVKATRH